jgi:Na+/phosphate symporter
MVETLKIAASAAGGLGLFLLAVSLISDGLKIAAGDALSDLLGKWARTPGRSIAAGMAITGIVQSSSAVTVVTIGFVNAGILTMGQALGVIYGANLGTTMTGWLVAAVGFKLNIELFALPILGPGMLLRQGLACSSTAEEIEGRPHYLDKTVLVSPTLALNALYLELTHVSTIVRRMVKGAISMESAAKKKQETDQAAVQALLLEADA